MADAPHAPLSGAPLSLHDEGSVEDTRLDLPIAAPFEERPVYQRHRHETRIRWFVVLLAAMLFLPNLGAFGLWDPWETHYGAVTTEMLETHDWISPWWGSQLEIGGKPQKEAGAFYSKPILIFWMEALVARTIGQGDWAVRLPQALLAILSVYLVFASMTLIWSRRLGFAAAAILATSPFFFMISRQAQTDMPFVATFTIAMTYFMMAFFGRRLPLTDRQFRRHAALHILGLALLTLPQYGLLWSDFSYPSPGAIRGFPSKPWHAGWLHALGYTLLLAALTFGLVRRYLREKAAEGGLTDALKDRWVRRFHLLYFYAFMALATYAKGLLGFALPGAILFVWLLVSHNWRHLRHALIGPGALLFIATGFPWYVAMIVKHGKPYVDRFFWHDHFNRLSSGVHQIDSGTFEHFIKWLGVGTFPWVGFVPFALLMTLRLRPRDNDARNQSYLLVAVWAAFAFSLFTASSTKFHHYIFPTIPALAILTALFLRTLLRHAGWIARFAAIAAAIMTLAVGADLHKDQQLLRNLMTYKYDRPLPASLPIDAEAKVSPKLDLTWGESTFFKHTSPSLQRVLTTPAFRYDRFIVFIVLLSLISLGLFFFVKTRKSGLVALGLTASALGAWSLNYYLPTLTPHWSQRYLFDAYYDTCTPIETTDYLRQGYEPLLAKIGLGAISDYFRGGIKQVCEEDVLSWLIVWRGEWYYSWNEIRQIGEREQFLPYMEELNGGRKFYMITEKNRESTIRTQVKSATAKLKAKKVAGFEHIEDWDVKVENPEAHFFQMISATPIFADAAPPIPSPKEPPTP